MTQYCTCGVCRNSPAQPNDMANMEPEIIEGSRVILGDNDTLVHFSGGNFDQLLSTELALINARAVNSKPVCISFFLYRNSKGPDKPSKVLKRLGLGGEIKYTMDKAASEYISIYQKKLAPPPNMIEVVVVVGCGGAIQVNSNNEAQRVVTTVR